MTITKEIKIESELLNKISEIAKDKNTTENKLINDILKKGVETVENKIPDYLIGNKNRKPDPEGFNKLIGIIKAPPGFDPVEAVREVRRGE